MSERDPRGEWSSVWLYRKQKVQKYLFFSCSRLNTHATKFLQFCRQISCVACLYERSVFPLFIGICQDYVLLYAWIIKTCFLNPSWRREVRQKSMELSFCRTDVSAWVIKLLCLGKVKETGSDVCIYGSVPWRDMGKAPLPRAFCICIYIVHTFYTNTPLWNVYYICIHLHTSF